MPRSTADSGLLIEFAFGPPLCAAVDTPDYPVPGDLAMHRLGELVLSGTRCGALVASLSTIPTAPIEAPSEVDDQSAPAKYIDTYLLQQL